MPLPQPAPQPSAPPSAAAQQGNTQGGMPNSQSLAPQDPKSADQVVGAMMGIKAAMEQFAQAFQGKLPPQAQKALVAAAQNYSVFLSGAMKVMGVQNAPDTGGPQAQSDMSGGAGSMSADSMAGSNPNAQPSY